MTEKHSGQCIILIEQSEAMQQEVIVGGNPAAASASLPTKPLMDLVGTGLNAALRQWAETTDFSLAIVGYRNSGDDTNELLNRRGEVTSQLTFEQLGDIVSELIEVETRTRTLPTGGTDEFEFPLFFTPQTAGSAPQNFAFQECLQALNGRLTEANGSFGGTVILHVCTSPSADGNPLKIIEQIQQLDEGSSEPLVFQIHMSGTGSGTAYRYPANRLSLPSKAKELHARSSFLPELIANELKSKKIMAAERARGLIYNARLVDLAQCLQLIPPFVQSWPAEQNEEVEQTEEVADQEAIDDTVAADAENLTATNEAEADATEYSFDDSATVLIDADEAGSSDTNESEACTDTIVEDAGAETEAASTEPTSHHVVCLFGRGVSDPYSADVAKLFGDLQTSCNSVVQQISETSHENSSASLIVYGSDEEGQTDIHCGFEGDSEGRAQVCSNEISDVPIRVIESVEEIPNGVGGLMEIPKKTPVYLEVEPASQGAMAEGIAKAKELIAETPKGTTTTILHFLLGVPSEAEMESLQGLAETESGTASRLYHVVVTEVAHPACSFPVESKEQLQADGLETLFDVSSTVSSSDGHGVGNGMCVNSINNLVETVPS